MGSNKGFSVKYSKQADKDLAKMDPRQRGIILAWIGERLVGCDNPRQWGKGLTGVRSREWRYRVGKYRILADILDDEIVIAIFRIGLRDKIYKV